MATVLGAVSQLSLAEVACASVFLLAAAVLFHAYFGYPLLVRFAGKWMLPRPMLHKKKLGGTVLLVAAHNEEQMIEEKVRNALSLQPPDLRVVVVSDGSTDGTDAVVRALARENSRVSLIRVEERLGKNHALNYALRKLALAPSTVVVFTDANAMYRECAVLRLRETLADGAACVIGKLIFTDALSGTARAEGLYWRYENRIKAAEGAIGRLPFANGAIFATTAAELDELPLDIANDFWIPLSVLGAGRSVAYEPSAVAWEPAAQATAEEFARKVRMGNRQIRGVLRVWGRLDCATRFQLVSHKIIRWFGIPLLVVAAASAGALWSVHPLFPASFAVLVLPFVLGTLGFMGRYAGLRLPVADVAAHFLLVHWAALCGVVEGLCGRRRATWGQAASSRVPKPNEREPAVIQH